MKTRIIISALLALAMTTPAFASEISGTLTGGAGSGGSLSGTVTGGSSGTLTGTVTAPSTGGGSTGGSGGGGGGGGSAVVTDYCPNIDGLQSSLPVGYGIQNGQCILLSTTGGGGTPGGTGGGTVLGVSTDVPNVPNTGAGGGASTTLLMLGLSAMIAAGGAGYLRYKKAT